MKIIAAAAATLFVLASATLPTVDLDGDGKPEKIRRTEEVIKLADGEVMCGGFDFPCDVIELDIRTSAPRAEGSCWRTRRGACGPGGTSSSSRRTG